MSRTQPSQFTQSPVEFPIFFNGKTGSVGIKKEEFEDIPFPFSFIVLDDGGFRVGGENRALGKRKITSNLAHRDHYQTVKVVYDDNGDVIAEGEWKHIKGKVAEVGGKFTLVIYILCKIDGALKTCSLHLRGRALYEWVQFTKGKDVTGNTAFTITHVEMTTGNDTDSYVPRFAETNVSEAAIQEAEAADALLQVWLSTYFKSADGIGASRPQVTRGEDQAKNDPKAEPQEAETANFPIEAPAGADDFSDLPF